MRFKSFVVLSLFSIAGASGQQASSTQKPAEPQNAALEEIVVTAQYRSESLQRVPMSMTAVTAATLEARDVKNLVDYANTIPNLSYGVGASAFNFGFGASHEIAIRGITGDDTTGFYLDDTPVPSSIDPHIVGVERIEVLRGPQGTLYGARSMGGTLRVISTQPDTHTFSATTHTGISYTDHTDRPNTLADGAVNLPLIPNVLALRAEAYYEYGAGFFTRSSIGPSGTLAITLPSPSPFLVHNVASSDEQGGSLSLLWQPNDALSITPRVLYQRNSYNGFPLADNYYDPDGPAPRLKPSSFNQQRLFNIAESSKDVWSLESLTVKYRTHYGEFTSSTSYFKRDVDDFENMGEFVYLDFLQPFGAAPIPAGIFQHVDFQRYVQEVRFASEFPGRVQLVTGAYFSHTYGNFNPGNAPPIVIPGIDAASGGAYGTDLFYEDFVHQTITEPAFYSEVSWNVLDDLKFTGGLRAYRIDTTNSSYQNGLAIGVGPLVGAQQKVSSHGVNPKYALSYTIIPDHLVYALAAKGFRPGGLQLQVPGAPALGCGANLAQFGLTPEDTRSFRSDSLWNYEVGTKNAWDGNRFVLNVAAYYMPWKNVQQPVTLPCGYSYLANAGAAKSEGGELEMTVRALPGLELSLGAGYEHAVITQQGTGVGALSPQLPGNPVFMVPDWTANLQATYSQDLTSLHRLVYHVGYAYVGNRKSGSNNPFNPRLVPAYGLLDGNVGLKWRDYELMLVGKNLSNTVASYGDTIAVSAEIPGRPRVAINRPRTIGLEFRATF